MLGNWNIIDYVDCPAIIVIFTVVPRLKRFIEHDGRDREAVAGRTVRLLIRSL